MGGAATAVTHSDFLGQTRDPIARSSADANDRWTSKTALSAFLMAVHAAKALRTPNIALQQGFSPSKQAGMQLRPRRTGDVD